MQINFNYELVEKSELRQFIKDKRMSKSGHKAEKNQSKSLRPNLS